MLCSVVAPGRLGVPGSAASPEVAYVDDELIGLLEPGRAGVLLAPRCHVAGLMTAPERAGTVLAALRRAADTVRRTYGTSGAMIEPTTELRGAVGHVCYRVLPTRLETSDPHVTVTPEALAAAIKPLGRWPAGMLGGGR